MAVVSTLSNHYKYQLMAKKIDFTADTIKIILMNTTFAFDKDAHATLADVTADQLSTANGYTQNDKALSTVTVAEDDTGDKGKVTWSTDPTWTASGGTIGPTGSAIIYDDTTTDDTVIGCIDFGVDISVPDGSNFSITAIEVDNA